MEYVLAGITCVLLVVWAFVKAWAIREDFPYEDEHETLADYDVPHFHIDRARTNAD